MDQEDDGTVPLGRRVVFGGDPENAGDGNNNNDGADGADGAPSLFPFPSFPDGKPSSPFPSSPSASSSGFSTLPEVSSEFADEAKMDQTNAWFLGHHHTQVVANMHNKFQDILDYAKTKNRKILHIDWIAGNPNDPAKLADAAAAWSGMTEEERRLRETVARMVMKHTHGTEKWDETLTWNKTMFFGDWLNDDRGFRQYFMEVQIKRISGDDPTLLEQCGISSNYVWLPMHDEHAPAITALVCPPANPRPPVLVAPGAPIIPHRQLPDPTQIARAGGPSRQQVIPPPVSDRATTPQPGSPPVSPPASPPTSSSSSSSGSSSDTYEFPTASHIEGGGGGGGANDTLDSPFNGDEIYEDDDDDEYEDVDSDNEDDHGADADRDVDADADADADADGEFDDDMIQPENHENETQDQSETQSQPTTQDKGKGKAPRITAAEFAQSLKKRTPLPSLSNFAQRVANWDMSSSSSSSAVAGPSNPPSGTFRPPIAPPPGIPRSRPLPLTAADAAAAAARAAPGGRSRRGSNTGFIPINTNRRASTHYTYNNGRTQATTATAATSSLSADTNSETSEDPYHNDQTHLTYTTRPVNSFDAVIPAHHVPAQSAADMSRHREEYDRAAYAKRLELDRIFTFLREPTFAARMSKSYIYAVRVVAFPDRGGSINNFTGPSVDARQGSIMALGGWVVPPMEERIKYREENPGAYPAHKAAPPGTYAGPPKPQVQNAMPAQLDWSAGLEPRYFGPVAPVWKEVCEPSLEDIYWMVWQLLAGKQFLGFQPGVGFGKSRLRASGDLELLHQCPFTSPSEESQYQAASYPRGKETK